tara:strand:- start:365 stop:1306 length:942 start_codon:yes stop_codon:yes gene_type:complete
VGVPSILGAALTGGLSSGVDFPRISIKASRFRIKEGDTETVLDSTNLDVVVVGANPRLSKTWYAKAWTKDAEPSAPDCYSLDGVSPDPEAEDPQNTLCASCPQNAWGSKVTDNGQQIKACSDNKRMAVVAADDASGPVYLLSVTPAALKGLNQYQKELSVRGIPPEIVKTRVSFDTDASFPKLKFTFGGFLDADVQEVVDGLFGSEQVKEITGEISKTPVAVPQIARAQAPAPVVSRPAVKAAAPVEEPAPAPAQAAAPKRGFGASKPVAAPAAAPVAKPAPAKAAAPAPAKAAISLADEIAALVGEVEADDA